MSELKSSRTVVLFRDVNVGSGILSARCWGTCISASDQWACGIFFGFYFGFHQNKMVGRHTEQTLWMPRRYVVIFYITEGKPRAQMVGNGKYLVGRGGKVCSYYLQVPEGSISLVVI